MITYKDTNFIGYLELLIHLYRSGQYIDYRLFPARNTYLCKMALESKFNRKFTLREVRKILKDKSWQWRTSLQVEDILSKDAKTHPWRAYVS